MPTCVRCNQAPGFLGALSFNKQTGRCGKCEKDVQHALAQFRQQFFDISADSIIEDEEWSALERRANFLNINLEEALLFIRGDALHFIERVLTFFFADGAIDGEEEQYVRTILNLFQVPAPHAEPILQRLEYLKRLTLIRQGKLPVVQARVHLESDETCHLDIGATYYKVNAKSTTQVLGRFVATNKKLYFISPSGGFDIQWKRIMQVERYGQGVYLQLSTKKGNGHYDVADPMTVQAVLETLVKIANRGLVAQTSDTASRHIPHDVRSAVWQRDQGKCVQCAAAAYLEFDHIIPFSKGGAGTVNNVQLLCRKCNLTKGSRL
jgi:5-methylcytosine-specific restriction endonuclease McrA